MQEQIEAYIASYGKLIFSLCYAMTRDYFDAEDLAQDTFVSAYRHLDEFDGENAKAWLTRIAANKCRDYLKSAQRRSIAAGEETLAVFADPRGSPEDAITERACSEQLIRLCRQLREPYQSAAIRHFAQGESVSELARREGLNTKTMYTRIDRAKQMLRRLWREETHA